jgi:lipoprotein-anchoring transpeptidase ErfK/SrfK
MAGPDLAAALASVVAALAGGAPVPTADPPPATGPATLVAELSAPTVARASPRAGGRAVTRLDPTTRWTRQRARYMITGRHRDAAGRSWVRVQVAVRPNGTNGWLPAARVRLLATPMRVVVRLGARRLDVWQGAHRVRSWPAGIGRPSTPTPTGRFAVQDAVIVDPRTRHVYGRYALILTSHSEALATFMGGEALIAIHGTGGRPWRVGRQASNGCVILDDAALRDAAYLLAPGTPVEVRAA